MNTKNYTRHLFGAVFCAVCFLVATGTSVFAQTSGQTRPFHAVSVEVEKNNIPNEIAPGWPAWESVSAGKATHLGKISSYGGSYAYDFGFDGIGFHLKGVDVSTLVAANGDELEITTDWRFYLATGTVLGEWEITGGTGRFVEATGSGTLEIVDGVAVQDGEINY